MKTALAGAAAAIVLVSGSTGSRAEAETITVAATTSMEASGLLEHLIPRFEAKTGVRVRAVATGTGQAIRIARRGDADVLFVHDRRSEEAFVADGFGVERFEVMSNDFVIVGPRDDPAAVGTAASKPDAAAALAAIAAARAPFASRGDDSGTHKAELRLWAAAGLDPSPDSGTWYRETGAGQGATLNTAVAMGAYVLCDRASWLAFGNRGGLAVLVEGDARLRNPYGVTLVSPEVHPHVNARGGQAFVDWLRSPDGQAVIGSLRVDGQPLFVPAGSAPLEP